MEGPRRNLDRVDCTCARADDIVAALHEFADAVRSLASQRARDPDALLTVDEVGELLSIPARTVRELAAAGALPHRRFGKHYRFSRDDIAEIVRLAGKAVRQPASGLSHNMMKTPAPRSRAGRRREE